MDAKNLLKRLKSTGIPAAHNVFLQKQNPPYLIYRDDETDIIAANSKAILKKQKIVIELYAAPTAITLSEATVENLLDTFTTYTKSRTFDEAEQHYVTYYQFYLR